MTMRRNTPASRRSSAASEAEIAEQMSINTILNDEDEDISVARLHSATRRSWQPTFDLPYRQLSTDPRHREPQSYYQPSHHSPKFDYAASPRHRGYPVSSPQKPRDPRLRYSDEEGCFVW